MRRSTKFLLLLALGLVAGAASPGLAQGYIFSTLAGEPGKGSADGPGSEARFYYPVGTAVDGAGNVYVADSNNSSVRRIAADGRVTTVNSTLVAPAAVAVDVAGNVFVAERFSNTIRKISPAGVATLVAGAAFATGSVDGPGAVARFNYPRALAVDGVGNVFVADYGNHTIRKITAAGVVSTFAGLAGVSGGTDGSGSAARFREPYGLAADASGNVFVADTGNHTIRRISSDGNVTTLAGTAGVGGQADGQGLAARFSEPWGIAVDGAGNVFVADHSTSVIRKITPGGLVTTVAGAVGLDGSADGKSSAARFREPAGMAADAAGNLFLADYFNHTVRKITPTADVTTLAGAAPQGAIDGTGRAARFNNPHGVAVDDGGNVLVADTGNHTIRRITASGVVTTLAGMAGSSGSTDGAGSAARFNSPAGLALDRDGNLYVADSLNDAIRKIDPSGLVSTFAGMAGSPGTADGMGAAARFNTPGGIAFDAAGNLLVADSGNLRIRRITPAGVVSTLTNPSGGVLVFDRPTAVLADTDGSLVVAVSDNTLRRVSVASVSTVLAGAFSASYADGTGTAARFNGPSALVRDALGNMLICDTGNAAIRVLNPSREVATLAGAAFGAADGPSSTVQFSYPAGLAMDRAGNLYVADSDNHAIRKGTRPANPVIVTSPASQAVVPGSSITLGVTATFSESVTYQWSKDGVDLPGANTTRLVLSDLQPASVGLYVARVTSGDGRTVSAPAIVGLVGSAKVTGAGAEIGSNIQHANGNIYDQVLLQGPAVSVTADPGQVTRISFVDLSDDIVQVEFSGPGTLSLVLQGASGPAAASSYNQPGVAYFKGHATIVIVGADQTTNLGIFSVGRITATNQALFRDDVSYDGIADIASVSILSPNGFFAGVRTGNVVYLNTQGIAGINAPDIQFVGPVVIGDIRGSGDATAMLRLGLAGDTRVAGGDFTQPNGGAVQVSGLYQLRFVAGTDSQGRSLIARRNAARLVQDGTDVTAKVVVDPEP